MKPGHASSMSCTTVVEAYENDKEIKVDKESFIFNDHMYVLQSHTAKQRLPEETIFATINAVNSVAKETLRDTMLVLDSIRAHLNGLQAKVAHSQDNLGPLVQQLAKQ